MTLVNDKDRNAMLGRKILGLSLICSGTLMQSGCIDSAQLGNNSMPSGSGGSLAGGGELASGGALAGGGTSAGGSDQSPDAGGTAGVACPTDPRTLAELAATPRADTNLELLALKFSDGVVADQAVYDRLVRDVGLIKTEDASVSDIPYFPRHDGKGVFLAVDAQTVEQMQAGAYHDWDCLNRTYGEIRVDLNAGLVSFAVVQLKGIYNLDLLGQDYTALPGVRDAHPDVGGGGGPTICVTRATDAWHYVFDRAGGDCPSGCTSHDYHHFTVDTAGTVGVLGKPTAAEIKEFASSEACR